MYAKWIKCANGDWCNLLAVNLDDGHFNTLEGVYIIWHNGSKPATVRVGQGFIKSRLDNHRQDRAILAYRQFSLYVTWASIAPPYRDGVEKYLTAVLKPIVGERSPDVSPIEVNLPW